MIRHYFGTGGVRAGDWLTLPTILWLTLIPEASHANGGVTGLLFINAFFFLPGFILIVGIEAVFHYHMLKLGIQKALLDTFIANAASTAIIGIGIPLLLAVMLFALNDIPLVRQNIPSEILAISTGWVFGDMQHYTTGIIASFIFWLIICFFLTVRLERRIVLRRLPSTMADAEGEVTRYSWYANSVTYTLLTMFYVFLYIT